MASHLYFGGKTVILDHGQGVFTSYGHMSRLLVKRGDIVAKGTVIGLIGSTGRSTGPHLHWSVRVGGARVDPRSLLALPLD
jgi:murein DD-endopeptidase MepM/ murein hydrolase activator NlpD